jgi:hypothetical protein
MAPYTGQWFMQAPQRMQRSISRNSSLSMLLRPLSTSTTWYSSGPSGSPCPARSGGERGVAGDLLTGGASCQQAQQGGGVFQVRHHLLDTGGDDVHPGQGVGEIPVALVGDDDVGAGLGDEEVGAGDAHVGVQVLLAQHLAGLVDDVGDLGEPFGQAILGVVFVEQVGDLALGLVHGGRDDVAGRFARQLDDVLAEIRLDGLHARRLQGLVHSDLFAHHGLALGDALGARLVADLHHDALRVLGGLCPVHLPALADDGLFVAFQVEIQVLQSVVLDRDCAVAQGFVFGQGVERHPALEHEAVLCACQRTAQGFVAQRLYGAGLEFTASGLGHGFVRC